jgi:hypothetical protein
MAVLSALQLREKYAKTVMVDLPDGSGQIKCRVPDFSTLVLEGLLPRPLMAQVAADLKRVTPSAAEADPASLTESERQAVAAIAAEKASEASRQLTNRWVCLVCLEPPVVLTREEVTSGNVCVEDLPFALKQLIVTKTMKIADRPEAVATFPGDRGSEVDRPDVPAVAGQPAEPGAGN